MTSVVVSIDCDRIFDWPSFHREFAAQFGFPSFYGNNLNAWIDCMSDLDAPQNGMSIVHCQPGSTVTLELRNVSRFKLRQPELYAAIIDCAAFVNWRRLEAGLGPVITLSFYL